MAIKETHFMETPVTYNNQVIDERTFVQLLPICLTEAPLYECAAFLQRVEKLTAEGKWEEVGIDRSLILKWEKVQHPQAEQALNIFFIQHKANQVVLCLENADIPWHKFASIFGELGVTEFKFYVQLTFSDKKNGESLKPVRVCLYVNFADDRFHPELNLKELDV
jgi:hypothetical protein